MCVDIDRYLTTIRDNREDYTLLVHAYLCRYVRGEIHLHAHHEYALVTPRELYSYQFEAADQPILDMLQENAL
nr:hypothetical protein [[Clostridium] innocuum]